MLVDNILIAIIYLAMYMALRSLSKGAVQIALLLGLMGIISYISSCKTFELISLASKYSIAVSDTEKNTIASAGIVCIEIWQGTSYIVYYLLNAIALLIFSIVMLRSQIFGKVAGKFGIVTAILMMIPGNAGMIGIIMSLLSLIPWYIFSIILAQKFSMLEHNNKKN